MPHTLYKTQGTCSQFIDVTVDDDGVIQQVFFMGGCDGNLQGICRLVAASCRMNWKKTIIARL